MIEVSVIIPNYNHAPYLKKRIDSVINQTYQGFEIIIVDDASSDRSIDIINEFSRHPKVSQIIINQTNSGSPFAQWWKAAEVARNEWIWIAESDDLADKHFLENVARALEANPNLGICYTDSKVINSEGIEINERFSIRKNQLFHTSRWSENYTIEGINELNEYLKFDCTINNMSCIVFKKNLLGSTPDDFSTFKYYGDWYFLISAAPQALIGYVASPLNEYRSHNQSWLAKETSTLISRIEYFRILRLMWYKKEVKGKNTLLDHFAYHYLSFGLKTDGLKIVRSIIRSYWRIDRKLAMKIIPRILKIKIFRRRRCFFIPASTDK